MPTSATRAGSNAPWKGLERDLQYAQAGIFVSSHCHILLALWDGRRSELLGGTAQVVAFILYADVSAQDGMIYLFLAFFLAGIGVTGIATRREWHRKYIDYRALAEGLRVQSFWRRAGIVDVSTPAFAHENFLRTQNLMVATMGVLSVAAAVHEAYAYKKADKEPIKQYRFMVRIFAAARRRLRACSGLAEQRQILRTLGEAALAEHAEWTLMHRERPLEHSRI